VASEGGAPPFDARAVASDACSPESNAHALPFEVGASASIATALASIAIEVTSIGGAVASIAGAVTSIARASALDARAPAAVVAPRAAHERSRGYARLLHVLHPCCIHLASILHVACVVRADASP
jgi:hypothetical protein